MQYQFKVNNSFVHLWKGGGNTHKDKVSEAKLHGAEHAQDDGHNVQEVGQDGGPLIAHKIKHLPLKGCHLWDSGRGQAHITKKTLHTQARIYAN